MVFVLDRYHRPLMPCSEKRARKLLEANRARVHKLHPFTIRIVDRKLEDSVLQDLTIKLDPGSKETGVAIVRNDENAVQNPVFFACLEHRGEQIHKALLQRAGYRRRRRSQLRYREKRFKKRKRAEGWLAPSIQHRVDAIFHWVTRLKRIAPLNAIVVEKAKFDTQKMRNPEISGIEYQQGTLQDRELWEYLLEKWGRKCAYCGATNVPLEKDHILAKRNRKQSGSDQASNFTLACRTCNQKKGNRDIEDFLKDDPERLRYILDKAGKPLVMKDAAVVNTYRNKLQSALESFNLPVSTDFGYKTKFNRTQFGIPKEHWLDALCVGNVKSTGNWQNIPALHIKCTGRGQHQRTNVNSSGFPVSYLPRQKSFFGFQTGDMVQVDVPMDAKSKKYRGLHCIGRVATRSSGSFDVKTKDARLGGISYRYCKLLSRNDGYGYSVLPKKY